MRISVKLVCLALSLISIRGEGAMLGGKQPEGFAGTFGLGPEQLAKDYSVQQFSASVPANVLWPHDAAAFTFQFVNKTRKPLRARGRVEVITYGTSTDAGDVFKTRIFKLGDAGSTPIEVNIEPDGFLNETVRVEIPEKFGAYALVVDLGEHGRAFAAACVRTAAASMARVQFPSYALDARSGNFEEMALFSRLGVRAMRIEVGYFPTNAKDFHERFAELAGRIAAIQQNNVTVMFTVGAGITPPQPLGRPRPHLDEKGQMLQTKSDMAWLPESDGDFQKFCKILAGTFGWPRGPLNAMELWNEPWEGISISGWGADMLRYRDLYSRMAQGVEEARKEKGVKVLIGGCSSSMNTEDKLFPDGKDTFLQWLDFCSIHYQPMAAIPALIPEWQKRKSPNGPVRVWDTESWVANSEDRVAAVIASMRAQGQSRTAGVLHEAVREVQHTRIRTPTGVQQITAVQASAPAAAVAACQRFIGERAFKEILFKNGLPWVFVFEDQRRPDDGSLVVVGDLGGIYERDNLLFRNVRGLAELSRAGEIKTLREKLASLPANAPRGEKTELTSALKKAQTLDGAVMTFPNGEGAFTLFDFYGNPLPPKDGKIVVPLNGLGWFLRANGSNGSFAKLVSAVKESRIDGYSPLEIVARDFTARIEQQPVLRLTLSNILNRPVSGKLSVKLGTLALDTPSQPLDLPAHGTKDITLKVTGGKSVPSNTYPLTVTFDAGADGRAIHEEELHVNLIAKRTIRVDGNLDDWKDALPQPIHSGESSGASLTERAWQPFEKFDDATGQGFATGYLAYDDTHFYFAAKIADSTPYEGNWRFAQRDDDSFFYPAKSIGTDRDPKTKEIHTTGELVWPEGVRRFSYRKRPDLPSGGKTDNVQIAFNVIPLGEDGWLPNPPGTMPRFMAYKDTDYEYALTQVADKYGGGTELWRMLAPGVPRKHFYPRQPKAPVDGGPVGGGTLAMRRDGNTRIVEAALPWSELPDVKKRLDAGEPVKFSFRVNDNAGPAYELAEGRSVSKINNYAFHDYWMTHWANEVEFGFEK